MFLLFFSVSFLFVLGLNPVEIGKYIGAEMGLAVGMEVGVPENPVNKLAKQLQDKENLLNERESALGKKEEDASSKNKKQDVLIFLMGAGIWALFVLIGINYYLDYKKRKILKSNINILKIGREHTVLEK